MKNGVMVKKLSALLSKVASKHGGGFCCLSCLHSFRTENELKEHKTLRKNCPDTEFFWSIFSRIWTGYGDLRTKSPYSAQIREHTDQKTPYLDTFHAVKMYVKIMIIAP